MNTSSRCGPVGCCLQPASRRPHPAIPTASGLPDPSGSRLHGQRARGPGREPVGCGDVSGQRRERGGGRAPSRASASGVRVLAEQLESAVGSRRSLAEHRSRSTRSGRPALTAWPRTFLRGSRRPGRAAVSSIVAEPPGGSPGGPTCTAGARDEEGSPTLGGSVPCFGRRPVAGHTGGRAPVGRRGEAKPRG